MPNYLIAAYSLRVKDIYDDIKELIPSQLNDKDLKKGRVNLVLFLSKYIRKAYKEGILYTQALTGNKETKVSISDRNKKKIFSDFIAKVKMVEDVYKLKMKNRKETFKLDFPNSLYKVGIQEEILYNEYVNAVKKLTNNVIITAGREGSLNG